MAIKKEPTKAVTVNFPISLIEEVDQICSAQFIARSSFLIGAAREYIENQRRNNTKNALVRILKRESEF